MVHEIAHVLRPGGRVLVMVSFFYYLHEVPYDFYRYTEFALRRFCEDAELRVVELYPYGGYVDILLDLFNKTLIKTERMARLYLKVCNWLQGTAKYRQIRQSSSATYPLGYCLAAEKHTSEFSQNGPMKDVGMSNADQCRYQS